MKQSKHFSHLRHLALLIMLLGSIAAFSQNYIVSPQKLNVRTSPNANSKVAGVLVRGAAVHVKDIKNGWARISYNGKDCYVKSEYLEKKGNAVSKSKATAAYTRSGSAPRAVTRSSKKIRDSRTSLWCFNMGGMPHSEFDGSSCFDWFLQLGGDFPINIANHPFTIETGLRYLNKQSYLAEQDSYFKANILEVPVRLAYDLPLANDLSFRVSAGPYLSYMMEEGGGLQVGVEPSVALKYKKVSLGLQYSAPLYKGYTNANSNVLMLTLGIRFNSKAWKGIGTGLAIAGAAAVVVGGAIASQQSSNSGTVSNNEVMNTADDSYEEQTTVNTGSRSSGNSREDNAERDEKRKKNSWTLQHGRSYQRDYAVYMNIIQDIKCHSASYKSYSIREKRNEVEKCQSKMKDVRAYYKEYSGKDIPNASNSLENWNPTDRELAD